MTGEPLLVVEGLEVTYGETQILWGVSFTVTEGSITALVGSNGAGKTTTLRTVAGLVAPRRGRIEFAGGAIAGRPSREVVAAGVSIVPEGGRIFPAMTVRENLQMGAYTPRARARASATMADVFALFPILRERLDAAAGTLSGGERQMLAIGIGLMSRPACLLIDEPSVGLAPIALETTLGKIQEINRALGTTVLMVEQNVRQVLPIADRVFLMKLGRLTPLAGPPGDLLRNEALLRAYLG